MKKNISKSLAIFNLLIAIKYFTGVDFVKDISVSCDEDYATFYYTDHSAKQIYIGECSVLYAMYLVLVEVIEKRAEIMEKTL